MLHLLKYHIKQPIICKACEDELQTGTSSGQSLRQFQKLDIGLTDYGVQIWCQRHNKNVCHFNFDGKQVYADFRCLERKENTSYDS